MAKVFFIGGAPRSGKTTAIHRLVAARPMISASTDAIRSVARGVQNEEDNPRLFKTARGAFDSEENVQNMLHRPDITLEHEIGESEETWSSVLDFIGYYLKDGKDTAVEGVAVLPSKVAELEIEHRTVFVVNLEDQTDTILEYAHNNPHDWLHKYSDEAIRAFCAFNQHQNRYYFEEAKRCDLPVVEVVNDRFNDSIDRAVDILLK